MAKALAGVFSRRFLIVGLLFAAAACTSFDRPDARSATAPTEPLEVLTLDGRTHHFQVEVVDTYETRERGLMFRKSLAPDAGMLFDFKSPQEVSFWMKNTLIPLDIVFIAPNGRVLNIAAMAKPLSEEALPAAGAVLGVLEIRGGRAKQLGIGPGALVRHRIFPPS